MERTEERTGFALASVGDWFVAFGLVVFAAVIPLLWSSTLASPFFTPKAAAVYPVGLLLILGVLLRSRPGELHPDRLDWAILVFVAVSALATLVNGTPLASFFGPYEQGTGFAMFLLAGGLLVSARRCRPEEGGVAARALVVGAVALTVLMWLQRSGTGWAVSHLGIPAQAGHAPGASLGQPVWSGAYVAAGLVAALVLFVSAPRLRSIWSISYAAGAAVCFSGVVISLSRGALLGAGLAMAVALVCAWPARARLWPRFAVIGLAVVVAASLMLLPAESNGASVSGAVTSGVMSPASDLGRMGLYRAAFHATLARPLLGWGPGNFVLAWQHSVDAASMAVTQDNWGTDAHDLPLEVMTTTGILGFLSLLAVAILFIATVVPLVRRQELQDSVPLLAAVALAVPLCLNPQSVYLTPLLFLLAGLATLRSPLAAPFDVDVVADDADEVMQGAVETGEASSLLGVVRGGAIGLVGVAFFASVVLGVVALQADARLLRGLVGNDPNAAVAAAGHFPVYPLTYFMAARALTSSAQTAPDSIAVFERGLRLRPDDAYGLQSLAGAYVIVGQPQSAVSTAQQALRVFPLSPMARLLEARALLALGQPDEALRLNREALSVTTPSARSYSIAAGTFAMAGDTATAKATLEEGLARYPHDATLRSALAQMP